jgi:Amt family ammonium transporter
MIVAALFIQLVLSSVPSSEEVDLKAHVEKLQHELHESIQETKKQAKKEVEMETMMRQMQKQIEELGASLEVNAAARQLYNDAIVAGWDADEDGSDDVTGKRSMIPEIATAMGTTWTILCGALVMFMHAGFALLETGVCRAVSCQSILMKNILNVCFGTMIWFAFGYAFMYGGFQSGYLGTGMYDYDAAEIGMGWIGPNFLVTCQDWFFQWAFCVTGATIVSGGVAERLQLGGYLLFTTWMTGVIYPCVGALTWGGGFLYGLGYSDFAGSGIVHLTGGVGALVGAFVTKPRLNRFEDAGKDPNGPYAPHNVPNAALGTFILWFGWYGFNCGSTLYMTGFSDAQSAALVAVNTTLAPAAGGIAALILRKFVLEPKMLTVTSVCGGILAGLVSITAGCGNIHPRAAIPVGFVGGVLYCLASEAVQRAKIDDPVEAFAVHGAGGIWGVLAVPLFDINSFTGEETLFGPGITLGASIAAQCAGIVVITLFSGTLSFIMFSIIKKVGLLRVEAHHEEMGIDLAEFSPKNAYNQKGDHFSPNPQDEKTTANL